MIFEPKEKCVAECTPVRKGYVTVKAGKLVEDEVKVFFRDSLEEKRDFTSNCPYYVVISKEKMVKIPAYPDKLKGQQEGFFIYEDEQMSVVMSGSLAGVFYGWNQWKRITAEEKESVRIIDYPDSSWRCLHLDFRFGFFKFERILQILDEMADYRYNAVLIEYENRYPYKTYPDINDELHFTKEQIEIAANYAKERYIEWIPLQQTIGHLEYMLKLPEYYELREVRNLPKQITKYSLQDTGFLHFYDIDEVCACNERAKEIINTLVEEMCTGHPDSKYIHIGCDEAWNLLYCEKCKEKYGENGKHRIYIEHINRLAGIIKKYHKIPLVWDDMLRGFSTEELKELDEDVVLLVWTYGDDIVSYRKILKGYEGCGLQILGTSALKCAEGHNPDYMDMPDILARARNTDTWIKLCEEFGITGLCATTWATYSGTIAPPHPAFDTAWSGIVYTAAKLWNHQYMYEEFVTEFSQEFFGIQGKTKWYEGNDKTVLSNFEFLYTHAKKHGYEAKMFYVMELLKKYRIKSLAISRELYRLQMSDMTEAEIRLIYNRMEEVIAMRKEVKTMVAEVLSVYYDEKEKEIFIMSRFAEDEITYGEYEKIGRERIIKL